MSLNRELARRNANELMLKCSIFASLGVCWRIAKLYYLRTLGWIALRADDEIVISAGNLATEGPTAGQSRYIQHSRRMSRV